MDEILIRPYTAADREAVRRIAWETAFMGRPADVFFSDRVLLEDFLTAYFTDCEPRSCFVAVAGGVVAGYVFGAVDERAIGRAAARMLPRWLLRLLTRSVFMPRNGRFLLAVIASTLKGEFRGEDFAGAYPSVLHINLLPAARGRGAGEALMKVFFNHARGAGSPGVHLATMSPSAASFFEHMGFTLLARHPRTYFRHAAPGGVTVSIYGRKLGGAGGSGG